MTQELQIGGTRLIISSIGPASSVQDGGRFGAQRFGLTPSGAMDRLALAAANCLAGNTLLAPAIEIGPYGAAFKARGGAVRVALAGAPRSAEIGGRMVAPATSATIADGETLKLGMAQGGAFSYLAIEGGFRGEPMFGSFSVNARVGLGSPFPRPLQAGDELGVAAASAAPERRIDLPAATTGPIRVALGPQNDEFGDDAIDLFLDSEWKISATSDRMGYRLEGPVIKHLHGHNIVSDGTVNGSIQVPGNGQPIVLMSDRGTSGGYPKIATVISADFGRFAQVPAGTAFRFKAISMEEAQAEARKFAELLRTLPDRLGSIESFDLNIEALQDANVAGVAVSAVDARTWQVPADVLTRE
ncbi:MAG: biotin-dependent carboxyltransferase family protein [Bradyrhizobium sp.]|uniref:5-oxoprolinase subunit C family protein n=1 Tax=Bradyrhizobium sp. TaxID=376 RepID=UPI003BD1101F